MGPGSGKTLATLRKKKAGKANGGSADGVRGVGPLLEGGGGEKAPRCDGGGRFAAELRITYFALAATLLATSFLVWELAGAFSDSLRGGDARGVVEEGVFVILVLVLI